MKAKIRVIGKDQNRTALGIVNAYVKINPNASLEELQKAFPASLNPTGKIKEVVAAISQASKYPDEFFLKPEELIQLKSGNKVAVKYLWREEDFHEIKKRAAELGIETKKIAETAPFEKGCFKLEMIEDNSCAPTGNLVDEIIVVEEIAPGIDEIDIIEIEEVRPEKKKPHTIAEKTNQGGPKTPPPPRPTPPVQKKKGINWLWWILAVLLLLLLLFWWKKCHDNKKHEEPVKITVVEKETIPFYKQKIQSAKIDVNGDLVYDKSGKLIDVIIEGDTLSVDSYATEAEVYNFLLSNDKKSDWIVLDQVHFRFNEVNFTEKALVQIKHVAAILKKWDAKAKIEIEGFADHIGTDAENQYISDERADYTAKHFINDGFPKENIISAVGLRDTKRLCTADDTPACRELNRRAEIRITK